MTDEAQQPPCCPKGSWGAPLDVPHGVKSVDGAGGESFAVGPPGEGLEVYVAEPPTGAAAAAEKKAVVVFTDVYGLQNRLFAILDKLAEDLNLYVVAVDCFRGETKDDHPDDFLDWVRGHPFDENQITDKGNPKVHLVGKDIEWCLEFLFHKYGVNSSNVGAVGFCWVVWAMTKACATGANFRCGVGFHPSIKLEDAAFGMDQVEMARLAAERTPMLYCVAGNDMDNLKPPDGEVARIISSSRHGEAGGKDEGRRPRCVEFPEQRHGWVSRGDTGEGRVREDAERALEMAREFLAEWM